MAKRGSAGPIIFMVFGFLMIVFSVVWFIGIDLWSVFGDWFSGFGEFMGNWGSAFGEFMGNWGEGLGALINGLLTPSIGRVIGGIILLFVGILIIAVSLKALKR